jgi:hypothetical protein
VKFGERKKANLTMKSLQRLFVGGSPMKAIGRKRKRLDPVFPPPDFHAMVQVSPLAIMALVSLGFDVLHIARVLPGVALAAGVEYVAGLIMLARRATAARITRLLGGLSHDALTRLREGGEFSVSGLMLAFLRLARSLGARGYLCLDDTFLPHARAKRMEGVYWDFDHALGRNVLGSRIVVLLWSDGYWRIPVAFSFWHKKGARSKYRTKNEIARTLLGWAIQKGLRPEYVTFDNWYASKENMRLIVNGLGLSFSTRLKKNARLLWEGRRLQARTIGRRLLAAARPGTRQRATRVVVGELGAMTFVVVRDDLDGQGVGTRYLLDSTPRASATRVLERYRSRWIIEVFFEDLKQHLSLGSYQGRSVDGQTAHVALAFAGLVVLDGLRKGTGLTLGQAREDVTRLVLARTKRGKWELVSLQPAPSDALDGLDEAKEIVAGSFAKVSQLSIPEVAYAKKAA